jgi:hypothetical protein
MNNVALHCTAYDNGLLEVTPQSVLSIQQLRGFLQDKNQSDAAMQRVQGSHMHAWWTPIARDPKNQNHKMVGTYLPAHKICKQQMRTNLPFRGVWTVCSLLG